MHLFRSMSVINYLIETKQFETDKKNRQNYNYAAIVLKLCEVKLCFLNSNHLINKTKTQKFYDRKEFK